MLKYLLLLLFITCINVNSTDLIQNDTDDASSVITPQHVQLPEFLMDKIDVFKAKIVEADKPNGFKNGEAELSSKVSQLIVYPIFDASGEIKFALKDFKINQFSKDTNSLKIFVDKQKMELRFFKTGRTILTKSCVNTNKDEDCISVHTKLTDGGSLSFTLSEDGSVQLSEQTDPIPSLGSFNFESATKGRKAVKMVFNATGMRNAQIKLKFSTPLGEDSTTKKLIIGLSAAGIVVAVIGVIVLFWCCLSPKCYLYKCRNCRKLIKNNQDQPKKKGNKNNQPVPQKVIEPPREEISTTTCNNTNQTTVGPKIETNLIRRKKSKYNRENEESSAPPPAGAPMNPVVRNQNDVRVPNVPQNRENQESSAQPPARVSMNPVVRDENPNAPVAAVEKTAKPSDEQNVQRLIPNVPQNRDNEESSAPPPVNPLVRNENDVPNAPAEAAKSATDEKNIPGTVPNVPQNRESQESSAQPSATAPVNPDVPRTEAKEVKEQTLQEFLVELFTKYEAKDPVAEALSYMHKQKSTYKMPKCMSDPPTAEDKRKAMKLYRKWHRKTYPKLKILKENRKGVQLEETDVEQSDDE